ncbi:3-hydroxybutyryl-CoA dehydrogenase [Natronolimnohabitans innermongolicus JCM 12255]|uniref:3-hydroxybutyryl-CoA dehydrogenase n=2 Tax=Natronolimnohabitans innermongolicus TaxID=253107 RepID=L9WLW3_9EURY|nr:3-hydroxybutyryl-CoA dehydrogenase [Natronolimnohabitans innermongolicus JCM 12255]
MGHGIAEVVAMAGYDVTMRDVDDETVEEGYRNVEWSLEKLEDGGALEEPVEDVMARIETAVDLEESVADADIVIEAVPEQMELKQDVFADVDRFAPEGAILASNTSSLSITEIASATERPSDVVGLHFFNPPVKMELVEVVYGSETADETAERAAEFMEAIGKEPIHVRKDVHRFVVNNVLGPFLDEPHWMVSNDEATVREVDAAMVHRRGYPMGPFELIDMTGIEVSYHVRQAGDVDVPPLMEQKVENEELGRKTGTGHYEYENGDGPDYEEGDGAEFDTLRVDAMIVNEAARLIGNDVATADAVDTGMRLGTGFPEGPCTYADETGIDVIVEKLESLHEEYGADRYEPAPYLRELVSDGRTGTDAGAGFYDY